jgi:cytochrome P450
VLNRFTPGKIVYANAAGLPLVILNDVDVTNELLDKKGVSCSDRPDLVMAFELAGFGEWTSSLTYGPRHKESRKYMHRAIGTRESLVKFGQLFESEVRKHLKAILRDPDNVQEHIRRHVACYHIDLR